MLFINKLPCSQYIEKYKKKYITIHIKLIDIAFQIIGKLY